MASIPEKPRETSREDDYRDYDERDIDEGWPYPDADATGRKRNEAYGQSPAGLEGDGNPGAEVAGAPAIRSEGGPTLSKGIAHEAIEDDALEEEIADQLSNRADLDMEQVSVRVRNGVAELTGSVETHQASAVAAQIAAAVPGIDDVRNRLVLTGLDSHIPGDANG